MVAITNEQTAIDAVSRTLDEMAAIERETIRQKGFAKKRSEQGVRYLHARLKNVPARPHWRRRSAAAPWR
ncbi:hypothetical protein [Bradyrhizobium sp. HKCCYLR20261]|uniref:hypothetical protein n=1 Tax=Bradyrhizobium sp. HKCCYLR20261 TaxID=3420760 RepID=UPI003EBDFE84